MKPYPPYEVVGVGIVACRDDDQLRAKLAQDGEEKPGERRRVVVFPGARGQGYIRREAPSLALPHLPGGAGPGVEGALVHREVQHSRVGVEDVLRAVAVVDVPVEDGDPVDPLRAGVLGGYRGVVQEAEAHPVIPSGVMARGAGDGEGRRSGKGALDGPDGGPARQSRGLPGVRVEARIQVEVTPALCGEPFAVIQVSGDMDGGKGLPGGSFAGTPLHRHAGFFGLFDAGERRREPLRGLHVGHAIDVTLGGGIAVDVHYSPNYRYRFRGCPRASRMSSVISSTSWSASM